MLPQILFLSIHPLNFSVLIFDLSHTVAFQYGLQKIRGKFVPGVSLPAESESDIKKSKKNHFNYLYLRHPPSVVSLVVWSENHLFRRTRRGYINFKQEMDSNHLSQNSST